MPICAHVERQPFHRVLRKSTAFLEMCDVYLSFMSENVGMASPPADFTESTTPEDAPPPTEQQMGRLEQIKRHLNNPPELERPDFVKLYVFHVDACGTRVGDAFVHEQAEGGLRPFA